MATMEERMAVVEGQVGVLAEEVSTIKAILSEPETLWVKGFCGLGKAAGRGVCKAGRKVTSWWKGDVVEETAPVAPVVAS